MHRIRVVTLVTGRRSEKTILAGTRTCEQHLQKSRSSPIVTSRHRSRHSNADKPAMLCSYECHVYADFAGLSGHAVERHREPGGCSRPAGAAGRVAGAALLQVSKQLGGSSMASGEWQLELESRLQANLRRLEPGVQLRSSILHGRMCHPPRADFASLNGERAVVPRQAGSAQARRES